MNPKLSIIIVNWNTASLLSQCLNSLKSEIRSTKFETEIIVVDNGSTDKSVEYLKKLKIKTIFNKENLGFAKGNNLGIKQAKGEYIMLLNTDTTVELGAIQKLVEFLDQNQKYAIVGPRLLNPDKTYQSNCGWFPDLKVVFLMLFKEHFGGSKSVRFSPADSQVVDWLMGAAFIARREVFDKIGGLDEDIFMYMEEVEWFYRTKKAGFMTYFLKDAQIVHLGRGSSKSGKKEPIINIYKGILHFYKKHRSKTQLIILEIMLKTKALISLFIGYLKKDSYLIQTYGQVLKIS